VRPQDSGRDCPRQGLAGGRFVFVAPDHLPARCIKVARQGDDGEVSSCTR
jgi:hypothetical protein